ncbi:MAG: type II toxin-antitoxin system VapC family toxin [Elusimicrobia bacterium]|nr:type II toxin-antitoxin system VapC family toxin [Elusimicrobiota bacterium]
MSRLLLDTSAYSALFRGDELAREALRTADEVYLTPVVIGELLSGFGGGRRRAANEAGLRDFLAEPRVRVAAIDEETSVRYAVIVGSLSKAGTPIPTNDVWIAASAMQHGLEVLTADAHYARVPQIVVRALGASREAAA